MNKDKERGGEDVNLPSKDDQDKVEDEIPDVDWDSNDDNDDNDLNNIGIDELILVSSNDLKNAIKIAFHAPPVSTSQSKEEVQPLSTIIVRHHRGANSACSQLSDQFAV